VRIVVPEGNATSYGSGTLVDVRGDYGLVVTNWHVVRDGHGEAEVIFPDGFRSIARPLKVDADWDLAALVIWRPRVAPVKIAAAAPQPGDVLTICGYGSGQYRAATGRCTQYYAPKLNLPPHMVELDVEARQGDSGGPIFNERGELAGVLFGAGQGTTLGSVGGRVEWFLASLAPDIGRRPEQALAATSPDQAMRLATAPPTPPATAAPVEASITAKVVLPAPANEVAKTDNALASDGTAGRPTPQSPPASATVNHGWHAVAEKKREPAPVAASMEPVPIVWDVPMQKVLVALGVLALASQLVRVAR
jgi:hypothetical protein